MRLQLAVTKQTEIQRPREVATKTKGSILPNSTLEDATGILRSAVWRFVLPFEQFVQVQDSFFAALSADSSTDLQNSIVASVQLLCGMHSIRRSLRGLPARLLAHGR